MKIRVMGLLAAAAMFCTAFGAGIDGKWVSEMKMPANKKSGGEARTVKITLDLKSEGSQLKGSVTSPARRRERTEEIKDGKIDGNKFSFTTTQRSRDGETKMVWEGTVEADELKGTRSREGARRGAQFTAKRQ